MIDSSTPSPNPWLTPPIRWVLIQAVVVSLIVGGLAGGVLGVVATHGPIGDWLEENIYPTEQASTSGAAVTQMSVQEDSAAVDVVDKVNSAVVSVIGTKDYSNIIQDQGQFPFDLFGFSLQTPVPQGKRQVSAASGFIISTDGLILTNKHVISDAQADYTVVLNDKRSLPAKVLAQDPVNDIAVLMVEAKDLPTVPLGNSDSVNVGQTVIAIGNALGEYRNTVTKGIISGKSRTIEASGSSGSSEVLQDVFQTDAAINPGNSGGPLLDLSGTVIGINTAVNTQGQLIGFTIPINVAKRDVESVQKTGKIQVAYLGVCHALVTPDSAQASNLSVNYGALIVKGQGCASAVAAGSPAEKAGLVENDIILEVNGVKIDEEHSLVSQLTKFKPGDTVTLKISHNGTTKDVSVILGERT